MSELAGLLERLVGTLGAARVPYMVAGSFASTAHGLPRAMPSSHEPPSLPPPPPPLAPPLALALVAPPFALAYANTRVSTRRTVSRLSRIGPSTLSMYASATATARHAGTFRADPNALL